MLKSLWILSFAAALGALIWILSPQFTGHKEPWDSESGFYGCSLVVAGFLPACFSASRFWLSALGVWLGQMGWFVFLAVRTGEPIGPLWPVGLMFLCFYSIWSVLGAALGAWFDLSLRRLFSRGSRVA